MNPLYKTTNPNATLVVLPAYNEEGSIAPLVDRIRQAEIGDILVVNDGSEDLTVKNATEAGALVLNLPFNLGIGGAVQAGLRVAQELGYSYVVRMDGDGQHKVEEIGKLVEIVKAGNADIAIGSRFIPGQFTYKPPFSRWIGIRWFSTLITLVTGDQVTDPTSGMFVANRRAIRFLAENYPQRLSEN